MNYDAWDIDIFYEDRTEKIDGVESITITRTGPICVRLSKSNAATAAVRFIRRFICITDSKRIDFDTWVDWHEHHILLKVAFPVNVMSPMATFDVQWGNVQRPTHRNTSWDWARFETCAHKWADLSEGNYGVALLNDCKYGYDIHDNVMRLTLLKSATYPDPEADQGEHLMTYSLLPHGRLARRSVLAEAYDLNDPLILRRVTGAMPGHQALGFTGVSLCAECRDRNGQTGRRWQRIDRAHVRKPAQSRSHQPEGGFPRRRSASKQYYGRGCWLTAR